MPEVEFAIRWADGTALTARSPSRAIERFLVAGAVYPRDEFVRRCADGLAAASERVRERYGIACTAAAETRTRIVDEASSHGIGPDEPVWVDSLRRLGHEPVRAGGALPARTDVVIVGGGQAGLATSWYLTRARIDHVVLERDRVASGWRHGRWDSFCLVTPNFQCRLPEFPYPGDDPDGFMVRDEIIGYVEAFAASFEAPLHEGVTVTSVTPSGEPGGGYLVATDHGVIGTAQVVLCVGGYHTPRLPSLAQQLPGTLTQLHSSTYRNPESVPDGAVLVVGTGQSGAQIAEDLLFAGRDVHLAVGSAPRCARRYRGRDCIAWLEDIGHYDMPVEQHRAGIKAARHEPNHYMTGRGWDHDIDLRAHARSGMRLHGRLDGLSPDGGTLHFRPDLAENLDAADATAERIKDTIDRYIEREGIDAPAEDRYVASWWPADDGSAALDLAAADVRTIVWATGFASDWSWVGVPGFLDEEAYPRYTRGVCDVPGLYVLGLPWLWTWGSGRFVGIARDAEHVVAAVAGRVGLGQAA